MVNAHTHLYSALAAFGLPPPSPPPTTFLEILGRFWWRLDRGLDAPMLRAAARYYVADALLHGTHTLIDHHESPHLIEGSLDILADACEELGIRAVLCYGATERNDGPLEAERGLAECQRFIRDNRRPLVRGLVGLHASFTVSDDTIRTAGELCRETNTVLHLHVAEDAADVEDARARGYEGVVDRLHRLGALLPGSILAHGVHLTRDEVASLASLGCWLVHNPRSNEHNGVGYAHTLRASPLVALGTDGFPSDMAAEAEAGACLARKHAGSAPLVAGRLEAGARLVAERFGWHDRGIAADRRPGCSIVDRLVIEDRVIVEGGRLITGDWDTIRAEAAAQAQRLAAGMATS